MLQNLGTGRRFMQTNRLLITIFLTIICLPHLSSPSSCFHHNKVKESPEIVDHHQHQTSIPPSSANNNSLNKTPTTTTKNPTTTNSDRHLPCAAQIISHDPTDVKFFLYADRRNTMQHAELLLYDRSSVTDSSFNPDEKTVILVHGYYSNGTSDMPRSIKDGYLDVGLNHNVIVVDWGMLSTPTPKLAGCISVSYYRVITNSVPVVARRVFEFMQFLIDNKFTSVDKLHLVGFSLGAHISGWAGKHVQDHSGNNGRKIARLTGLDPAGPGFRSARLRRIINVGDAEFVDIYHTAVVTEGNSIRNLGHADFFPNGGRRQPGCPANLDSCSHAYAYYLYAASIHRDVYSMPACLCEPEFKYVGSKCPGNCSTSVFAGEPCPSNARGQFFFRNEAIPHLTDSDY